MCNAAKNKPAGVRLNSGWLLLSLVVLALGLWLGKAFEGIAFLIWIGGGIVAFATVTAYGYGEGVSRRAKEAALWFLLGDLLVFFLFLLKPV